MTKKRDSTIDITRALAIALMVYANMAVLSHSEPLWIVRFFSSLAAPIFITLTTMMSVFGIIRGKSFRSALSKGLFLIGTATLLDCINGLLPLQNMDILYLIGVLMVVIAILGRFSFAALIGIASAVLLLTPYLQWQFTYRPTVILTLDEISLSHYPTHFFYELPQRLFIDGWFPLFPWLSIALFGALLGKIRYGSGQMLSFANRPYYVVSALLLVIGGLLWKLFPGEQLVRYQYIELFYEPTPGFMLMAMGCILAVISALDFCEKRVAFAVIQPLGEASLFMYCFHIWVIEYLLLPLAPISFGWEYGILYLALISGMTAIGYGLRFLRPMGVYRQSPQMLKWFLG